MRDSNPAALFTYVAEQLNRFGLAYLHIIEPRVKGNVTIDKGQGPVAAEQLRKVFKGKIIIKEAHYKEKDCQETNACQRQNGQEKGHKANRCLTPTEGSAMAPPPAQGDHDSVHVQVEA